MGNEQVRRAGDVEVRRLGSALFIWLMLGMSAWAAEATITKDSIDGVPYLVATPAPPSEIQRHRCAVQR